MIKNPWEKIPTDRIKKFPETSEQPDEWADTSSFFHQRNSYQNKCLIIQGFVQACMELACRKGKIVKLTAIQKAIVIITIGNVVLTIINLIIKFT